MIDVDRMESQLHAASKGRRRGTEPWPAAEARRVPLPTRAAHGPVPPSGSAPPAIPPVLAAATARVLGRLRPPVAVPASSDPAGPLWAPPRARRRLVDLVNNGELVEADRLMADEPSRRETVSWATMRALVDGRQDAARASNLAMLALAQENRDRDAMDRYWLQRFWLVAAWGTDDEHQEVLERCRDSAYRADDLQWTAALAVLLAQTGHADEAGEAFEDAFRRIGRAEESIQLDVVTNLVEAAALMGDALLSARLHYTLTWTPDRLVTVGNGWICKGPIERFRALGEAAVGMFTEADENFQQAVVWNRALGAKPLLAHTLHQWGTTLVGRDDVRAAECFREADALARQLGLVTGSR